MVAGKALLDNCRLRLTYGRKYGLIGRNGIGKTTLLNGIARKELEKFPKHLHVLHVEQEIDGDDVNVLDHILRCDVERLELMRELEKLLEEDDTSFNKTKKTKLTQRIVDIQARLEEIGAREAESKAAKILSGLGFNQEDFKRPSKEFSGGWRMRISLAKALFSNPDLLLLDEPTNHLDLDAVMWLENYITGLDITVVVVSHAREFLNNISEEIIHFFNFKLEYYKGDYDNFEKVRSEKLRQQKK